jgi:hypothetical protein
MERFVHYIITPFNYGLYKRSWDKEAWMEQRLDIFRRYTLPSLQRQTNQNFKWLIRFDPDTPEIPDFGYDNIVISHDAGAGQYLNKHVRTPWLITSRIDNDDYYEPTFVEEIQRCFDEREMIIDVDGRQLDAKTGLFYAFPKYRMNSPFLSLIEKRRERYRTVKCYNHGDMRNHFPGMKIHKKLVVQVIHDTNQMNRLTGVKDA